MGLCVRKESIHVKIEIILETFELVKLISWK